MTFGTAPVARKGDPDTSWEAAQSVKEKVRRSQREVLALFHVYGPMTHDDLVHCASASSIRQSESGLRTRANELVRQGTLSRSGKYGTTPSGRRSIIWALTPSGTAQAAQELPDLMALVEPRRSGRRGRRPGPLRICQELVDGEPCPNPHHGRGLCLYHWRRRFARTHGMRGGPTNGADAATK